MVKYLIATLCLIACFLFGMCSTNSGVPPQIQYHTASDLTKATGVEFPDVVPIDSEYSENICLSYTRVRFIPKKPLSKDFFEKLDKACIEDPCCWSKTGNSYQYYIYPERPLDRTKGTHIRQVEMQNDDGTTTMVNDWDGDYVSVTVPFNGDTITIEDGWIR